MTTPTPELTQFNGEPVWRVSGGGVTSYATDKQEALRRFYEALASKVRVDAEVEKVLGSRPVTAPQSGPRSGACS